LKLKANELALPTAPVSQLITWSWNADTPVERRYIS